MSSTTASWKLVTTVPIEKGPLTNYSLKGAGEKTFRFLHIPSLLEKETLAIFETKDVPNGLYACISYPWAGLPRNKADRMVLVDGLTDKGADNEYKDTVSVPMLSTVCSVAYKLGTEYLWLDKLCVRQDEGLLAPDKLFQIPHMYDIYNGCTTCFVLPGGMFQFAEIDQNTTWIDRAWTLQEALAPKDVRVLFHWREGRKVLQHIGATIVEEGAPSVGMTPLKELLECNIKGTVKILDADGGDADLENAKTCQVALLTGRDKSQFSMKALLGAIDHTEGDGRLNAIWRCLIMRSAWAKEDLIFSSMGIMGVTVTGKGIKEGTQYNDIQVTDLLIRYVQAITAKQGRAEWLGIAPSLGVAVGYSALPTLPLKTNLGRGFIEEVPGSGKIIPHPAIEEDGWWSLSGAPQVTVHETADLSFTAKFCSTLPTTREVTPTEWLEKYADDLTSVLNRSTNQMWTLTSNSKDTSSMALQVGKKTYYTNGNFPIMADSFTTLLMLVTEIEPGRYRNKGYAWADQNCSDNWQEGLFRVGG